MPLSDRSPFVPVPTALFGPCLEEMEGGELKCLLRALFLLARRTGPLPLLARTELEGDALLARAVGAGREGLIARALEKGVSLGLLLHLAVERDGGREDLYCLNTPANRRALERVRRGEVPLPDRPEARPLPEAPPRRDIFRLYEENIGLLTPLIAEDLKEAERLYPPQWIEEAFREAVRRNKRSWRYISAILRRWASEGKEYGAPGEHPEKVPIAHLLRRKSPPS